MQVRVIIMFERLLFPEKVLFGRHHKGSLDKQHTPETKEGEVTVHQLLSRRNQHHMPKDLLSYHERANFTKYRSQQFIQGSATTVYPH